MREKREKWREKERKREKSREKVRKRGPGSNQSAFNSQKEKLNMRFCKLLSCFLQV